MTTAFEPEEAARILWRSDPRLAQLIDRVGPCRLTIRQMASPFEALLEAIVYQQLTGKAAATILGRVRGALGGLLGPEQVLDTPDEILRGAGLSGAKTAALKDLAQKTLAGALPAAEALDAMTDEEVIAAFTAVRGVGRWTAEMLLIFQLGRPDVLPVGDYGVLKGFAKMLGRKKLPGKEEVLRRGERWRPYRTVATWYLWRSLDPG
jgi:3-methyladenine DNA glycosylase/8-oxoguanine DNA glycosylase